MAKTPYFEVLCKGNCRCKDLIEAVSTCPVYGSGMYGIRLQTMVATAGNSEIVIFAVAIAIGVAHVRPGGPPKLRTPRKKARVRYRCLDACALERCAAGALLMVKSGMTCQGGFLFDDGVLEGQVLRASANATDRPNAGTDQQ